MAPPAGSRRREGCLDDSEDWLRTYSDPFACKERAAIRNHRFLRRMMNQAKTEDGELRERLGCRRSSRISPSFSSAFSDLGVGRPSGLPTVVEIEALMGLPTDDRDLPLPGGVSDVLPLICPLVVPLMSTQVEVVADLSAQGGDVAHPVEAEGGSVVGGLVDGNSPRPPVILVKSLHCLVIPETGSSDFSSLDSSAVVLSLVEEA
ncbi:hypothetical protein Dimus_026757 [Dionaea muscipula]